MHFRIVWLCYAGPVRTTLCVLRLVQMRTSSSEIGFSAFNLNFPRMTSETGRRTVCIALLHSSHNSKCVCCVGCRHCVLETGMHRFKSNRNPRVSFVKCKIQRISEWKILLLAFVIAFMEDPCNSSVCFSNFDWQGNAAMTTADRIYYGTNKITARRCLCMLLFSHFRSGQCGVGFDANCAVCSCVGMQCMHSMSKYEFHSCLCPCPVNVWGNEYRIWQQRSVHSPYTYTSDRHKSNWNDTPRPHLSRW